MRTRGTKGQAGFTLVELLIVVVILGILAAVVVFSVGGVTKQGKRWACKTDMKTVEVAAEAHRAQHAVYAGTLGELVSEGYLRELPASADYTITYGGATGVVSSAPSCDTLP